MPFISEEIWQYIQKRNPQQAPCICSWPNTVASTGHDLSANRLEHKANFFSKKSPSRDEYSQKKVLHIGIKTVDNKQADQLSAHFWIIERLERVKLLAFHPKYKPTHSTSVLVGTEIIRKFKGLIDLEKEKKKFQTK